MGRRFQIEKKKEQTSRYLRVRTAMAPEKTVLASKKGQH